MITQYFDTMDACIESLPTSGPLDVTVQMSPDNCAPTLFAFPGAAPARIKDGYTGVWDGYTGGGHQYTSQGAGWLDRTYHAPARVTLLGWSCEDPNMIDIWIRCVHRNANGWYIRQGLARVYPYQLGDATVLLPFCPPRLERPGPDFTPAGSVCYDRRGARWPQCHQPDGKVWNCNRFA